MDFPYTQILTILIYLYISKSKIDEYVCIVIIVSTLLVQYLFYFKVYSVGVSVVPGM